jgi:hypothetical protein
LADITARDEVAIKDRSSISKKAKAEGWKKGGEIQQLVEKKVESVQRVEAIKAEIQQKDSTDQRVINTLADERTKLEAFFRNSNVLIAKTVSTKVQRDGVNAGYAELNAAATAIAKTQESVLGKSPDTIINNTVQTSVQIDRSPERVRSMRDVLDAAL